MRRILPCILFITTLAHAAAECDDLKSSGDGVPADYYQAECRAQAALSEGDLEMAAKYFRVALEVTFFEAPNYALLVNLGEVLCELRQLEDSRKALEDFLCVANADLGIIPCTEELMMPPTTQCAVMACEGHGSELTDEGKARLLRRIDRAKKSLESCAIGCSSGDSTRQ
jgi:hypothetical protein